MRDKYRVPVFVFNCHYNGLGLIQALGRKGVPVYALDTYRDIGTFSRYARFIKVSDPLNNERKFIDEIIYLAKDIRSKKGDDVKPLLLPTNDHWAAAISRYKDELSNICTVCVSDIDTVQLLLNKYKFAQWCCINHYLAPSVYKVHSILKNDDMHFPIAIKAVSRRKASDSVDGLEWSKAADFLRFKICHTYKEVETLYKYAFDNNVDIYAQQLVNGNSSSMRTIGVFANNGVVSGILFGKKIKGYPALYGDCIVGQAEPVPLWAKELVCKICMQLKYTGIAEFELMEDSVSLKNFIIEINPRSWSWNGVCSFAGVDLAWLAYSKLVLKDVDENIIESCSDGKPIIYIKILQDFLNTIFFYRMDGFTAWVMGPISWIKQYHNIKKIYAEFHKDDIIVSLIAFKNFLKTFLRASVTFCAYCIKKLRK